MKGHSSDDAIVAEDATVEPTEDRSPCAEPTLAKPNGGSSTNTITVDAGGGCRVVIDLRVTVEGGCAPGASVSLADPPDPDTGGGPPDPEMPVTLYRHGTETLTAFVLWAKNSRLEEVQTAHQAGFKLQTDKPLSLFMTALTDDKKLWYRGFGVADLRYMQKATAITAPGHSDVQTVKTRAYGCHISSFDFDTTSPDGLKIDVTYKLADPQDNRMRAVVVMPSEIAPPGGAWEDYVAQGGFSAPIKPAAEQQVTLSQAVAEPNATQKLYAFVVLTELPVDDPSALPVIDSPVRVLVG